MTRLILHLLIVFSVLLLGQQTEAGGGGGNKTWTEAALAYVYIDPGCTISVVNNVNFGSIAPDQSTSKFALGEVDLSCPAGVEVRVSADWGKWCFNFCGYRRMKKTDGSAVYVHYTILQPIDLTSCSESNPVWDSHQYAFLNLTPYFVGYTGTRRISICGYVLAAPSEGYQPGSYSDTVHVQIQYP